MKRVLLVVDVSNLYFVINKRFCGRRLDYEKYLKFCAGDNQLFKAIAYGASLDSEAAPFIAALHHLGYETRFKEPSRFSVPDSDKEYRKADWDVGMAMDVVRLLSQVDVVIFGTADGDLTECAKFVREQGKECRVVACNVSKHLRNVVCDYHEIDERLLK